MAKNTATTEAPAEASTEPKAKRVRLSRLERLTLQIQEAQAKEDLKLEANIVAAEAELANATKDFNRAQARRDKAQLRVDELTARKAELGKGDQPTPDSEPTSI